MPGATLRFVAATPRSVASGDPVELERVERVILVLRGHRVILDRELAALYQVTTSGLNKAVSRNRERFPPDFMLELSAQELRDLKFHFGTSSWGGTRKPPRAFTEQGIAMLSGVLRSARAVRVNVEIMRAFVRLRGLLTANEELSRRLHALEARYDSQFKLVFQAISDLMTPPEKPQKRIGFKTLSSKWKAPMLKLTSQSATSSHGGKRDV